MGRNYYRDHSLTLARHPSENDERLMVRLLAFALHADERLLFGESIANDEEPSLWQKDLTGAIEIWIDVGQPEEKRIRKASGRSRQVFIYAYGGHSSSVWLDQVRACIERSRNVTVVNLPSSITAQLAKLARRSMKLQFTIQDRQVWVTSGELTVHLDLSDATAAGQT
jgi:uncharacterized protein YaeQ